MVDINVLKQRVLSDKIEDSIQGIDQSINIVSQISDILLEGITQSKDRLITTERISLLFDNYLKRLRGLMKGSDNDLSFWAASLLIHYNLPDFEAENILLNSIRFGELDKLNVAIVILCRNRNQKVVHVINERLNDIYLPEKTRSFLIQHLNDLGNDDV